MVGIGLGKMMGAGYATDLFLGRAINLLTYLIMVSVAIWITPRGRWIFFVLGLFPMALYEAASVSADAMTISLSMLFVAQFLKFFTANMRPSWGRYATFVTTGLLLALSKPFYAAIVVIALFVPAAKLSPAKNRWAGHGGLFGFVFAPLTLWALSVREIGSRVGMLMRNEPRIDAGKALDFAFAHPGHTVSMYWHTFVTDPQQSKLIFQGFTGLLGWMFIDLPWWVTAGCYLGLLLAVALTFPAPGGELLEEIPRTTRVSILLLAVGIVGGIATIEYLTYTIVGYDYIEGMQGRYLIPVAALLVPVAMWRFQRQYAWKIRAVCFAVLMSVIVAGACWRLIDVFDHCDLQLDRPLGSQEQTATCEL